MLKATLKLGICLTLCLGLSTETAIAQVCGDDLFGNGFEYGDLSDWSNIVNGPAPPETPTVYRIDSLTLRDPHVFVNVDIFGCLDATDDVPLVDSVNDLVDAALNQDGDMDGCLDTTSLLAFRPWVEVTTGSETVDFRSGQCASATDCAPGNAPAGTRTVYNNLSMGTCLEPVAGTTSGYNPAVGDSPSPCFSTFIGTTSLGFLGTPLNLQDVELASTWSAGAPPSTLINGLLYGFLLESEADQIILPAEIPVVGGMPLSALFPGGTNNCSGGDDRDTHNDESGWWVYFNFTASQIPWTHL